MKRAILVLLFLLTAAEAFGGAASRFDRVTNTLGRFLRTYGLQLLTGEFGGSDYARFYAHWNSVTSADAAELERYARLFMEEFGKYPVRWVKRSGVRSIALVKGLSVTGQNRAAMPDNGGMAVYYDIGYGDSGEDYERECVHHEFFHLADYHLAPDRFDEDPDWLALNTPGFKYGPGGWVAYETPDYENREHPVSGFLNHYSTLGLCEDRAEIYSYLFTPGYYDNLIYWSGRDLFLAKKVKEMLFFIGRVCPEINGDWLKKLHSEVP